MQTQKIRRGFLQYFKDHKHSVVASSSVVPHDDPTLLFINAGMNQFKDVFLGKSQRDYTRAATSQKCIRVGGKHNDLENVGHTRRHLTFFEMLGNFSFGDYFKKDAIQFAWEVSTNIFGFDPNRLWPTVFQEDDEAFELWTQYVPAERITRMGEKTNFWQMGDTGPCGPCSEILYDRGPKYGTGNTPLEDIAEERFLEYWNLVFMQFNRVPDGTMERLPKPSIDTGAGLERVVSLQMDVESVFETDVLRSLIAQVENITGLPYKGIEDANAPAYHVIADHLRCLAFAIADGAQPSNVDRGYVLRKVLRRAVRYGRTLGLDRPFLGDVLPRLVADMGEDYPELKAAQHRITEILAVEEEAFLRTLRRGGNILNQIIQGAHKQGNQISGDDAFKLKDTYGLPIDEILLIAKDANLTVDQPRYDKLEEEARERSRKVHKTAQQVAESSLFSDFHKDHGACKFIGYDCLATEGKVIGLIYEGNLVKSLRQGQEGMIILDQTTFYAEKGGQVGDLGLLSHQGCQARVTNTQEPYAGVIAHSVTMELGEVEIGEELRAEVDQARRQKIANNHTATHLLHWALQEVLGEHIKQAGSVVDPQRLRFDFNHHKGMSPKELRQIEDLVNAKVRANQPIQAYELSYEDAQKKREIKQFFGDKYGAKVRVIDIDYSKELCGGTHTASTGTIGYFRIAKEGSIAAGVRRIEAVTGHEAEEFAREGDNLLHQLADQLKTQPNKLETRIAKLAEENKELAKELEEVRSASRQNAVNGLINNSESLAGTSVIISELAVPVKELRAYAEETIAKLKSGVVIVAAKTTDSCSIIAAVSDDQVGRGIKALDIIKSIAPTVQGSGGGKPGFAQAGGKAPEKVAEALTQARQVIQELGAGK
ncbi:MAG: alanine--tRNA ligase [Chlamydiales bacterium]|nr:alanine--tRNA ligase [Chlamydiales bacterium]